MIDIIPNQDPNLTDLQRGTKYLESIDQHLERINGTLTALIDQLAGLEKEAQLAAEQFYELYTLYPRE